MVESMVFTLLGLHARRASHNGCRGKLQFLYPSNKILLQFSWTQFPVNHNKWPFKRLTLTRDTIQYETKLFSQTFSTHSSSHSYTLSSSHSQCCFQLTLQTLSHLCLSAFEGDICFTALVSKLRGSGGFSAAESRDFTLMQNKLFGDSVRFSVSLSPVQHDTWSLLPWAASQAVVLPQWRFPKWHPLDLTRKIITRCRWGFFIETDLEKFNNRLSAVNGCQHESPISW